MAHTVIDGVTVVPGGGKPEIRDAAVVLDDSARSWRSATVRRRMTCSWSRPQSTCTWTTSPTSATTCDGVPRPRSRDHRARRRVRRGGHRDRMCGGALRGFAPQTHRYRRRRHTRGGDREIGAISVLRLEDSRPRRADRRPRDRIVARRVGRIVTGLPDLHDRDVGRSAADSRRSPRRASSTRRTGACPRQRSRMCSALTPSGWPWSAIAGKRLPHSRFSRRSCWPATTTERPNTSRRHSTSVLG